MSTRTPESGANISIRILLLEDNPTDVLLLEQELQDVFQPSVQITVATRLDETIAFAQASQFDVCLLDLNVPDSSGLATFERMRAEAQTLPLIVFTGAHDEQIAGQILRSGAQDYLVKQAGMGPLLTRALRFAIERKNEAQVELAQRDAQLLRSENQIRRIIEANADAVIVVDGEGLVQFVNPAAGAMFGRTARELVGGHFGFPMLTGQAAEIDLVRPDRSTAVAEMRVVDVLWEDRPALLASLRDVTERKRGKKALEIRAQLATLSAEIGSTLTAASTSLSGGLQLTTEVLIRYMDIAFASIWTRDEASQNLSFEAGSGTSIDADSSGDGEPLGERAAAKIAQSGEPYSTNDAANDPIILDGDWAKREDVVSFAGYPIEVEGKIVGVLVAFGRSGFAEPVLQSLASECKKIGQFITRRRADEEIRRLNQDLERQVAERTAELRAANAELESFSYSVAHDLRAPIRHIAGFSMILAEECAGSLGEQPRRYLQGVQDSAKRMGELVDDLLKLARISRQTLSRQPTILNDLVEVVRNELQSEYHGREIEWRVDPLWTAHCDSSLIRQVFVNLLSNAIKFTSLRSRAVIHVGRQRKKRVGVGLGAPGTDDKFDRVIFVRDNGAGFDMAYADKLFGVFQRLHRREDFEGTGVGLANVQRIVHKHGGQIWAESTLGQGATFFFTIPDGFESGFPQRTPAGEMVCVSNPIEADANR